MKTTKFILIIIGIVACGSVISKGQQPNPPGSYLKSCYNAKAENGSLSAYCNPKNTAFLGMGGDPFATPTTMDDFFLCEGDIGNNNGKLTCNKNPNSLKMKNTRAVVKYGLKQVLGSMSPGDTEIYYWLGRMFHEGGLQPKFFQNQGLQGKDAEDFFQAYLAAPKQVNARKGVITVAFNDIYGWDPSTSEYASYDADFQKGFAGYYFVVLVEQGKLNANKATRRLVINNSYVKSFGRGVKTGEVNYWLPRTEISKELIAAERAWLYTDAGQTDLIETVSRAVQSKYGSEDNTLKNQMMAKAKAGKLIFSEMVQ